MQTKGSVLVSQAGAEGAAAGGRAIQEEPAVELNDERGKVRDSEKQPGSSLLCIRWTVSPHPQQYRC